ncbi:MAG: hypothetical protein AABY32_01795 [Nanoarchaeota archaeon]
MNNNEIKILLTIFKARFDGAHINYINSLIHISNINLNNIIKNLINNNLIYLMKDEPESYTITEKGKDEIINEFIVDFGPTSNNTFKW